MGLYVFRHLIINQLKHGPQDRIEKISNSIDALNPFEEKKIFLLHQYFLKVLIYSLIVKEEFRYHQNC